MIITNKKRLSTYKGLSPNLDKGIDFILSVSKDISLGRHTIDGDDVYANVGEIIPKKDAPVVYEAHRKYIDIHYILEGVEVAGCADLDDCTPTTEYSEENDCILLKGEGQAFTIRPEEIYIVYPEDAHAPGGTKTGEMIKKIVVKVKV